MNETQFSSLSSKQIFLRCAIPSVFCMIFSSLYTIADGIFVGKFLGADALAAVNLLMPLLLIVFAFSDLIAIGSCVQISIKLGEKNEKDASAIFTVSIIMLLFFSGIFSALGFFFSEEYIQLLGGNKILSNLAYSYLQPFIIASPLIMIYFALDNYLRVCGRQKYSMVVNIITSILNIFLDWMFLAKLGKGIAYAGIATAISISLGTILLLLPFIISKLALKFTTPYISLKTLFNIFYNGSSEFLSASTGSVIMLAINTVLLNLGGSLAVSAFSIVMYIDSIAKPILFGMADSIQPAISYNLGAKNPTKIFELVKINLTVSFAISMITFILVVFNSSFLVSLFAQESSLELITLAKNALLLFIPTYLFVWFNTATSILFTSLNKPAYSIIIMLSQAVVFPAVLLFVLPNFFGVYGVFMMGLISQPVTFIIALVLYKKVKIQVNYIYTDP